jgi:uncharacterized glyoxalase superfamily protein PhnB
VDVYPSLTYRDVEAALGYLEAALGFEPVIPGGIVLNETHCP